ncbi:GntR family transcriptional regulator [Paenibacillus humicola]|uniref:GntR family transcriptional regulator n=1 Tax=Paenibacillus humicola TaxID=3110540 RepID=UPI00237A6105|nr:GntR family transcriptional regulator [Paenibacillus humicola]
MAELNRLNRIPLYLQLKEVITEKIENGEWLPGEKIPTEDSLQKQFDISRITVRQAISDLVVSGLLTRIQGKGTFVAEPKLANIRPELTGFTYEMGGHHAVESLVLDCSKMIASERIRRKFDLSPNVEVMKLERIRLVDGQPVGLQKAFLNISITPGIDLNKYDFSRQSLYASLEAEGVELLEAEETVEAKLADDLQASLLRIPAGAPVMHLTRLTKLKDGRTYEYAEMIFRGDKYKYTAKLNLKP